MRAYAYAYEHHCCGVNLLVRKRLPPRLGLATWEEFIDSPWPRDARFSFYQIPNEYEDYLRVSWGRRRSPWWIVARGDTEFVVVRHGISRAAKWNGMTHEEWAEWDGKARATIPYWANDGYNLGSGPYANYLTNLSLLPCMNLAGWFMGGGKSPYGRKYIEDRIETQLPRIERFLNNRKTQYIQVILVANQIPLLTPYLEKLGFKTISVTRNPGTRNRLALLIKEPDEN